MSKRVQHLLPISLLLGLFTLASCGSGDDTTTDPTLNETPMDNDMGGAMNGDTMMEEEEEGVMMDEPAMMDEPDDTMMGSGGTAAGAQVAVTNPMPHAMNVMADWGQGEEPLGTVEPNQTETFDIPAEPGTEITLSAMDEAETHNPTGTITAEEGATWTIQ